MNSSYSRWVAMSGRRLSMAWFAVGTPEATVCGGRGTQNGALASEYTRVNGVTDGTKREWHDNGVLAKEVPHVAGRVHGIVRQWNKEGKLLGEYTMSEGRGTNAFGTKTDRYSWSMSKCRRMQREEKFGTISATLGRCSSGKASRSPKRVG